MSQEKREETLAEKKVVLHLEGMEDAVVQNVAYKGTGDSTLTMDIYYPPESQRKSQLPVVVFVFGYPDAKMEATFGVKLKDFWGFTSWGRLVAASGLVGITYQTCAPAVDVRDLLAYIRQHAAVLGIDADRIGMWACSGNVPNALSLLMEEERDYLKCAVLCNGFMLDLEGTTNVAEMADQVGFVNPGAGKSFSALAQDIPLFIV